MSLDVDLLLRRDRFTLDLRFESGGRTLGVTGPSGSGKTTLLGLIAGTVAPTRGRIEVSGQVFLDTRQKILVPPHRRSLGYVFQDGRLFPHLTVAQNLRFGRWFARGRPLPVAPERIVAILGIGSLLGRRVTGLSGGEQQRVAIGRALFAAPRLLLMDEPLAALDRERRQEILPLIERVRDEAGIPLVYVSHVEAEIFRLADDLLRMKAGRLVEHRRIVPHERPSPEPRSIADRSSERLLDAPDAVENGSVKPGPDRKPRVRAGLGSDPGRGMAVGARSGHGPAEPA